MPNTYLLSGEVLNAHIFSKLLQREVSHAEEIPEGFFVVKGASWGSSNGANVKTPQHLCQKGVGRQRDLQSSGSFQSSVMVTAVVPACNEAERISTVIKEVLPLVDEVLVIDDGSEDETPSVSRRTGAMVISQPHRGYVQALKRGFASVRGSVIVTLDADGEHDPSEIPELIAPLVSGEADLVLGRRTHTSLSERCIGRVVKLKIDVSDHGTGFRAIRKELAVNLTLKGKCTCGVLVLECASRGARIKEVPITVRKIKKSRRRKWVHILQMFYVVRQLIMS